MLPHYRQSFVPIRNGNAAGDATVKMDEMSETGLEEEERRGAMEHD